MEEKSLKIIPKPPVVFILSLLVGFFLLLALYFKFIGPIPISVISTVTTKTDIFTTTGEGKVTAVPDIAKVNLGITINRSTVKETQNEANKVINKITDDIKKLGINEKDIKTTTYNLNPTYDWSSGKQRVIGYQITINLEVKVRDFEKINQVIDMAIAGGANLVGGLQFSVDEPKLKELKTKARAEAIKEAKEKAENLTKAAGINLGKIVNIQENLVSPWEPRPLTLMEATVGTEPTKIEPGEQEIRVSVSLSYEIQ